MNNKVLYLGSNQYGSTSQHRAHALRRIGYQVYHRDPSMEIGLELFGPFRKHFHYITGYRFLQNKVCEYILNVMGEVDVDIVWVDSGELFGREAVKLIKSKKKPIVLFNHDDPTGERDRNRFFSLRQALPYFDLVTAVRQDSFDDMSEICPGVTLRLWRTYDEIFHRPIEPTEVIPDEFRSDVCFVGTWMRGENRDLFLLQLIKSGLNISIWGNRWNKSEYWPQLRSYYRGSALSGREYVYAVAGAKICLGLLSKGNRDLHTTRSMEIPYAGGLLCAQRTSEHLELYVEGVEAVFWNDAEECAQICNAMLANESKRKRILLAGMERVRLNSVGNEDACRKILNEIKI